MRITVGSISGKLILHHSETFEHSIERIEFSVKELEGVRFAAYKWTTPLLSAFFTIVTDFASACKHSA